MKTGTPNANELLASLPATRISVEHEDRDAGPGFLRVVRRTLRAHFPDGSASEPFPYDEVDRSSLDAVVVVAHFFSEGARHVYLRSAVRPPVVLRDPARSPIEEPDTRGLWELVAGLVEQDERYPEGLRRCAARELLEEAGFDQPLASFLPLGPSCYPAPAVLGERLFFFHVEVDPARRQEPTLDGSALEAHAAIISLPLSEALAACRLGQLEDAKTELGLRRFAELEQLGQLEPAP